MNKIFITLFLYFIVVFNCKTIAQTLPKISESEDIWYYIMSGNTNSKYANTYITDINETGSGIVKFELQKKMAGDDYSQQWKLIKPVNAENDNVHFVNRATQNIIQTEFDFDGYYNVQSTTDTGESNGWKLEIIVGSQIRISGIDHTGTVGYLNASSDQNAPEDAPENFYAFGYSVYAWIFKQVVDETSIQENNPFANVKLYVQNRKIIVENADDYTIYHISGVQAPKNTELPTGVYLVRIQGKTQSILVK